MWGLILVNKLSDRFKISFLVFLSLSFFILSGFVAKSALDGVVRIVLQFIFLCNLFAYMYDMTMYGPHLYLRYSEGKCRGQVLRFSFAIVCVGLCVVCLLY